MCLFKSELNGCKPVYSVEIGAGIIRHACQCSEYREMLGTIKTSLHMYIGHYTDVCPHCSHCVDIMSTEQPLYGHMSVR